MQEVYCHISMSSGAVLCVISIGRIRECAGQHFSNRERRRVGCRRAERRQGGITGGHEQIGQEREKGEQKGVMGGWQIKREVTDGTID